MLNETLVGFNKLHEVIMPASVDVVKEGKFVHFSTIEDKKVLAPPEE
jgi:branched-chain amino acid transport system substrate-binding protein